MMITGIIIGSVAWRAAVASSRSVARGFCTPTGPNSQL